MTPREHAPNIDLERLFDRLPPHSIEAEMALLGSMILDHRVIPDVTEIVPTPSWFYREAHAAIFEALTRTADQVQSGDLVQLMEALRSRNQLDDIGGADYLVRLAESVPSAVSAPHYARIVARKARLRMGAEAAGQILYDMMHAGELAGDDDVSVGNLIDAAQQRMFDVADQGDATRESQDLRDLLAQEFDRALASEGCAITGLDTGFYDLSEMLSGLQAGEMIVVAGRPSMGKTAFALNLAEQVAMAGDVHPAAANIQAPVGIFSLEMSREALTQRLLCAHAQVDSHKYRTNRLSKEDFHALNQSCAKLSTLPIIIDDTPGLTVMQLRTRARRMVARHGVRCLMIDYLQLMSAPGKDRDGRQNEVGAISRGIKALARELRVPVICLSQLNRGPEDRAGNRPRMSDLRESGSIEQDADVVMLLHREEYYHQAEPGWKEENPDKVGIAEVIVAKQRNGPTGTVELVWDARCTRFRNASGRSSFDSSRALADQPKQPSRSSSPPPTPGREDAPF